MNKYDSAKRYLLIMCNYLWGISHCIEDLYNIPSLAEDEKKIIEQMSNMIVKICGLGTELIDKISEQEGE